MPRGNLSSDMPGGRPPTPTAAAHREYPGVVGTTTRDRVEAGVTPLAAYLEEQQLLDTYFYDTEAQLLVAGDGPDHVSRTLQRNQHLQQRLETLRQQREPLVRDICDRLIRGEPVNQGEFELAMKDLVDSGVESSFLLESKLKNDTGKVRMDAVLRSLNLRSIQVEGVKEMTSEQPPLDWRLWRRNEHGKLQFTPQPFLEGVYNKMPGWLQRWSRKTAVTGVVGTAAYGIASVLFGPASLAIWGTGVVASTVMGGLVEMERTSRQKGKYEAYAKSLVASVKKMHDLAKEWREEIDAKKKPGKFAALIDFVRDQDEREAIKGLKTVAFAREEKDFDDKKWDWLDSGLRTASGGVAELLHGFMTGASSLTAHKILDSTFFRSAVGFGTAEVGTAVTNYGRGLVRHAKHHRQHEARQQNLTELKSFMARPPLIYSPAEQAIFNYQPGTQGRDGTIAPPHPVLKRVTDQLRQFPSGVVTFRDATFIARNYPEVAALGPTPMIAAVAVDKNTVTLLDPMEPGVVPTTMPLTELLRTAREIRSYEAASEEQMREMARALGKEYPQMDDLWRLGPPGYDGEEVVIIAVDPTHNQIRYVPDPPLVPHAGAIRTMDLSIFVQYYHLESRPPADPAAPAPLAPAAAPAAPVEPPAAAAPRPVAQSTPPGRARPPRRPRPAPPAGEGG